MKKKREIAHFASYPVVELHEGVRKNLSEQNTQKDATFGYSSAMLLFLWVRSLFQNINGSEDMNLCFPLDLFSEGSVSLLSSFLPFFRSFFLSFFKIKNVIHLNIFENLIQCSLIVEKPEELIIQSCEVQHGTATNKNQNFLFFLPAPFPSFLLLMFILVM